MGLRNIYGLLGLEDFFLGSTDKDLFTADYIGSVFKPRLVPYYAYEAVRRTYRPGDYNL